MNKTTLVLGAVLAGGAALAGCSSSGSGGRAPDEFRVVRKAPLTIPPDYNLRPPAPGEARPQELKPADQARAALFGTDFGTQASDAEKLLVRKAGGEAVSPDIRAQVDYDSANLLHKKKDFADKVLTEDAPDAEDQEVVDNATGGDDVIVSRKKTGTKLPGL